MAYQFAVIEAFDAMKQFVREKLHPRELIFHDITKDYYEHIIPALNEGQISYFINSYANSIDDSGNDISFLFDGHIQEVDDKWSLLKLEIKEQKGQITSIFA